MKKKVLMMAVIVAMLGTAANAQTRVGELPGYPSIIPSSVASQPYLSVYTSSGHYDEDGNWIDTPVDSFAIYNANLQLVQNVGIVKAEYEQEYFYMGLYAIDGAFGDNYLLLTQRLFNNDDDFEYMVPAGFVTRTNEWEYTYVYASAIEIKSCQTHNTINTISCDEGYYFIAGEGDLGFFTIGNQTYLVMIETNLNDRGSKYVLFRVDRQSQSVTRVEGEMPIHVFPSVADRSQTITVELGEGNNATEVQVVNAVGQVMKTVAVQPGQREVKLRASDLNCGMHIVGTRSQKGQGACKIIVK